MKKIAATNIAAGLFGLSLIAGTAAWAEEAAAPGPSAEALAFLASPTSLAAAIATVESAAGGKASTIEFVMGEDGEPDLIMADVVMADGSEKEVSVNPADGKVMKIADDRPDDGDAPAESDDSTGGE